MGEATAPTHTLAAIQLMNAAHTASLAASGVRPPSAGTGMTALGMIATMFRGAWYVAPKTRTAQTTAYAAAARRLRCAA